MKIQDAIKNLKESKKAKFDETVDITVLLNLKKTQLKEVVRGTILFPNKFGADKKIIVITDDEKLQKEALSAGAVRAGFTELVEEITNETFKEFDIVITTPSTMPKIAKLGKVLGPKGLMPNPKNGTIVTNPAQAVESFKGGIVNFRSLADHGTIALSIGKLSMDDEKLAENFEAAIVAISTETKKINTPAIKRVIIKSTMGPAFDVDL